MVRRCRDRSGYKITKPALKEIIHERHLQAEKHQEVYLEEGAG